MMAVRQASAGGLAPVLLALSCILVAGSGAAAERDLTTSQRFPATTGERVVIDAGTLDVHLRSADVPDVLLETRLHIAGVGKRKAESWISAHTPAASDGEGELRVAVPSRGAGFLGLGYLTAHARLGVLTPTMVVPDVTTTSGAIHLRGDFPMADPLMLRSAGGAMTFVGAAGAVDVRSTGGHAELRVVRPLDRFVARTSSGGLTLVGGAREVHADTASGDVALANLSGSAEVHTTTGAISLSWDRLDAGHRVIVHSSSGKIELALPEGVRPQGTLVTTTGTIRCEFPGTRDEAGHTVTLAGDGPSIEVETASADIVLRLRADLVD